METRNQLLLLGNGINRSFALNPKSWEDLMKDAQSKMGVSGIPEKMKVPFPQEIIIRTNNQVKQFLKEYHTEMYGNVCSREHESIILDILRIGFNDILTTNYSYELETAFLNCSNIDM